MCFFFLKTIKGFVNLASLICQLVFGFCQLQFHGLFFPCGFQEAQLTI